MTAKTTANEASELRKAIDEGKAQDKVDYPDPATAPLGTDAEAGGHPVTEKEAAIAYRHEAGREVKASPPRLRGFGGKGLWPVLLIALAVIAVLMLLPALF